MRTRIISTGIALLLTFSAYAQTPPTDASSSPQPSSADQKGAPTTFVVKFRVKPGKNAEFEKVFLEMQAGVREHEPGNVYYDFFVLDQDPQTYVIVERYKDAEAAAAHGKTEHAKKMLSQLQDLLDGRPEAMRLVLISPK